MLQLVERRTTLHNGHGGKESGQLDGGEEELVTADTGEGGGQGSVENDMTL